MNTRAWRIASRLCLSLAVASFLSVTTMAGVYSDDLAKCLVDQTSAKDQTDLLRWLFAAVSVHPGVADLVSVTPDARSEMTRKAGQLFERLLTESCSAQFRDATKYEGAEAVSAGFQVLGQVAMRGLMEHADVQKELEALGASVSQEKLDAVTGRKSP